MGGYKQKEQFRKTCRECNVRFWTNRTNKVYCSQRCANRAWVKDHPRTKRDTNKDIRKGMADVEAGRVEDYEDILN